MSNESQTPDPTLEFDKIFERIFTLSTGALALSITFRGAIIGDTKGYLWLLSLSWVALGISSLSFIMFQALRAGPNAILYKSRLETEDLKNMAREYRELRDNYDSGKSDITDKTVLPKLRDDLLAEYEQLKIQKLADFQKAQKMAKSIPTTVYMMFISFFIGVLLLLIFGIISNTTEAHKPVKPPENVLKITK